MLWKVLISLGIVCCATFSFAQKNVTGTVVDNVGEPLPGVSIAIKGTTQGVISDIDGKYSLTAPNQNSVLVFSYIGYQKQEIAVGNRQVIDVTMLEDTQEIDEVLVVGYGTQRRQTLTTSISKLDTKSLEKIPYSNAAQALKGTMAGVSVQATSGQPGSSPRIMIRGGTSINNMGSSTPLYIIDGVQRTDMDDLDTRDIESLQIMKDAASTTIYGARASNGVVIITTKKGAEGKSRVSYSYELSVSQPSTKFEMASARDYIYWNRVGVITRSGRFNNVLSRLNLPIGYGVGNDLTKNTAFTPQYLTAENQYKLQEGWESMEDPADPSKTIIFKDTNFQDLIFRTALTNTHHIDFSGGNDKARFYAGIGYVSDEGVAITTEYNRYNFDISGDIKILDNLSMNASAMYSNKTYHQVANITNIFYRSAGTPPSTKYAFEDGSLAPGLNNSIGNPVYILNTDQRNDNNEKTTLSVGGKWEILPKLVFAPQLSMLKNSTNSRNFTPAYWNGVSSYVTTRTSTASYDFERIYQAEGTLSYNHSFANVHNISAMGGYSYYFRHYYTLSATGTGAATDNIPTMNASPTKTAASNSITEKALSGFFGRLNYDYQQKYLLSLNLRYDGASNLGADYKWGLFPGISAGYNMHYENYWEPLRDIISQFKLRGSYGVTGNISGLGEYTAQGTYSTSDRYMDASAIRNTVMPNSQLQWEQSKTLDGGLDLGLFGNRINMVFDVYRRVTDNLLTSLSLPPSTGFTSVTTNYGSLENKGVELELTAHVMPTASDLQWDVTFNASKTKHKILSLPYNGVENNRVGGYLVYDPATGQNVYKGGLQEGGRVGDYYTYWQSSIYATDAEAANAPEDLLFPAGQRTKYGGDINFLDVDGNGLIETYDRVYVGNQWPTWNGGFGSALAWKGLEFSFKFDFTTGHTLYNYARLFMDINAQGDGNQPKERFDKAWKEQGDITDYPRFIWQDTYQSWRGTQLYYEKGDFLYFRNMTLSYIIPQKFLQPLKISNLRFHVAGNNLWCFTKYKGLNPDDIGQDNGHYPLPTSLIFGLNISF